MLILLSVIPSPENGLIPMFVFGASLRTGIVGGLAFPSPYLSSPLAFYVFLSLLFLAASLGCF